MNDKMKFEEHYTVEQFIVLFKYITDEEGYKEFIAFYITEDSFEYKYKYELLNSQNGDFKIRIYEAEYVRDLQNFHDWQHIGYFGNSKTKVFEINEKLFKDIKKQRQILYI